MGDEHRERIDQARDTIGKSSADDWSIRPTTFADRFAESAPRLEAVLRQSAVTTTAESFEQHNQEAKENQRRFKQTARRAAVAVMATTIAGALIMIAGVIGDEFRAGWLIAFGVLGIVAGSLGTMWMFILRQGKLLDAWMRTRAQAETDRLEYFARATTPTPGETGLALLRLEFFRRYQLEVQRTYYRGRGAQHRAGASRTLGLGAIAVFLAAVATGLGGILGAHILELSALAALGIVGSALGSMASSSEAANQDRRNAERYDRTRFALDELKKKLDDVRTAVATGDLEVLPQFVKAVHEELSLEHRQWLKQSELQRAGLAELERHLEEARGKLDAAQPGQPGQP